MTVLILALLNGCGFHLRGLADKPSWLKQVAIVTESAHPGIESVLKDQLQAYNIGVTIYPTEASYWLIIERDFSQRQITSISASTTPRQYQLVYTVFFRMVSKKGKIIIPSAQVSITRQLTINNDRILSSDAEESLIQREMLRDASFQMINRLIRK